MRILVVEDERSLANTIVEVLERECYVVDVCYNGLKVLDKIEAQIYDVIVLDIMLPGCKVMMKIRNIIMLKYIYLFLSSIQ